MHCCARSGPPCTGVLQRGHSGAHSWRHRLGARRAPRLGAHRAHRLGPEQGRLPAVRFSNTFAYGSRRRLHSGRGGHGHRLRHSRAHRRHGTTHPGDERDDEPREAGDGTRLDRCRHGGVRSTVLVVVLAAGSQESLMGMAHHGGHGLAARLGRRMHGGWRDRARPGSGDRRRQGAGVAPLSHSR